MTSPQTMTRAEVLAELERFRRYQSDYGHDPAVYDRLTAITAAVANACWVEDGHQWQRVCGVTAGGRYVEEDVCRCGQRRDPEGRA